jgi:hypothetical protein
MKGPMNIERAIQSLVKQNLLKASDETLNAGRNGSLIEGSVYADSLFRCGPGLIGLARTEQGKKLIVLSAEAQALRDFTGVSSTVGSIHCRICPLSPENAAALRAALPWTAPVSLADRPTTFGCGDRLGRATPGHLRAARQFKVAPVLAQQSIRELTLTHRTFRGVVDDVTFQVLQAGYTLGYGADADHLKTLEHIRTAIEVGMTMITLDLSEVMRPDVARMEPRQVAEEFAKLPAEIQDITNRDYAGKSLDLQSAAGKTAIAFSAEEARLCAVMYTPALDFAREVYALLKAKRGEGRFDLEMSIDETTTPTLPAHHLFIIRELIRRGVKVVSLAPRFIGEFQKGIDYMGDLAEFTRQFTVHTIIAQTHGNYKISIHSGSDKFSIFPIIGRITGGRFHEKTAGTSWLEAVRLVATQAPRLYRKMHKMALERLPDALKLYHITPDLASIPDLNLMKDSELAELMNQNAARQVLHVTYGFLLDDPAIHDEFFQVLDQFEEDHYRMIERHFVRHMEGLGIPRR